MGHERVAAGKERSEASQADYKIGRLLYQIQAMVGWRKNYCIKYKQRWDGAKIAVSNTSNGGMAQKLLYQIQAEARRETMI